LSVPPDPIPSNPNPATTALIYAVLRHVLTFLAAVGVTLGGFTSISDSNLLIVAGAVAWFIGLGLSLAQKVEAARRAHKSAIASARTGRPVKFP
jgi:hypothetical protein